MGCILRILLSSFALLSVVAADGGQTPFAQRLESRNPDSLVARAAGNLEDPNNLPSNWFYWGCWTAGTNFHGNFTTQTAYPRYNVTTCIDHCFDTGYNYAVVQGIQYLCSESPSNLDEQDPDEECTTAWYENPMYKLYVRHTLTTHLLLQSSSIRYKLRRPWALVDIRLFR
ncbi:hypothetical protein EJ02DRAFT_57900 [Clathrospora elynae]|uniref:WSC domain-containing protein n=1 Tax=Clathrospora elynae TaxID=706981 RepID=A0A6A5S9G8_9PLEO|nr:hypothetical protein EJ02DRAFT_57900 [Clathrospora elynae]